METAKKWIGWTRSTGDDFVLPLIIGMMIGRIGCFLTGLDDHTYGVATTWMTGVDFGDGIKRHPTQLYEIFFLGMLIFVLFQIKRKQTGWEGLVFQLFMLSYLSFRFMIDFIKPTPHPYWILNNIQLASLLGIAYYLWLINKKQTERRREIHA